MRNGVNVGSTFILARLLSPDEFGLTGMVATLTALLLVFSDMGLSWATVQRKTLNEKQVNNLFWVNVAAGALLWLVCVILAPGMAAFYGRSELVLVTIVMGASFLISGLAVQPMALMTRAMNFRPIAVIEITGIVAGALAAIAAALAGLGYWALVLQSLVSALSRMAIAMLLSRWRLALPDWNVPTWHLVSFGGLLAANGLLIYLARNLDNILIGKVWGATELGVYGRAYLLMLLPSMLINGVLTGLMVSSLSTLQETKARFADVYRRAVRLVAYAGTPLALGLGLTAGPVVTLAYGPNWAGVVPILAWLSVAGATQPVYNTNGWLFMSTGQGRSYLVLTTINTAILATVFFIAIEGGAQSVARGYALAMGLAIPLPALWYAHHAAGIPFSPTLKALLPVAVLNGLMALAVWGAGAVLMSHGVAWLPAFITQVIVGASVYIAMTPILLKGMLQQDLIPMLSTRHKMSER